MSSVITVTQGHYSIQQLDLQFCFMKYSNSSTWPLNSGLIITSLREKIGKIKRQPRAYTQLCTSHLLGGTCAVASELAHSWERNASRKSVSFQHLPVTHLLWFQNHPSVEYSAKSQWSIIAHRKSSRYSASRSSNCILIFSEVTWFMVSGNI